MHPALKARLQAANLSLDSLPANEADWASFVHGLSVDLRAADNERYTLERALEIADERLTARPAANDSRPAETPAPVDARLALLEQAFPDCLLVLNKNGAIKAHYNLKSFFGLIQEPPAEVTIYDVFQDSAASRLGESIANALHEKCGRTIRFSQGRGKQARYFEARINLVESQVDLCSVLVRNTTANDNALGHDRLIKSLFEASSEGMLLLDKAQAPVFYNKAFASMSGLAVEEIHEGMEFYGPGGDSKTAEIWQHVYFAHTWCGEAYIRQPEGDNLPIWLAIDTVQDADEEISHYLLLMRDITQLKRSQEHLVYYATHDQLTGLPNRDLFRTHLEAAIERVQRTNKTGAVFFLDLDNFKVINDTLGHAAGDALLLEIAARLKNTFRKSELISRIGGDEFTLVLESLESTEEAQLVAERLLQEFEKPFTLEGQEFEVTCSMGISLFPDDGQTSESLVKQADTAMYSAKEDGKNTYRFYTTKLTQNAMKKFNLEVQLRKAIERDEFYLAYQPQYDMRSGKISGAEVLLRWENEAHGPISPAAFIPLAERTGQIDVIGQWVLESACRQLSIWNSRKPVDCVISVNVSRRQLVKPDFVDTVQAVLGKYSVPGSQLEIEVTESAIASSEQLAIKNLKALQELGCEIAIDDFGTGYSSLGNLKNFPLNRLKIDKSFVNDLGVSPNADSIISAVIALAKSLQLGVIAEGVENKQQVAKLLQKGCYQAQGYYFSKPLPATDFRALLVNEQASRK